MNEQIKPFTTWRDIKGRLWVITSYYFANLEDALPTGITIYRVGSADERQFLDISEFAQMVEKKVFYVYKN